jgi:sugar lactone lactonase YvrE
MRDHSFKPAASRWLRALLATVGLGAAGGCSDDPGPELVMCKAGTICTFAGTGANGYNGNKVDRRDAWLSLPVDLAFDAKGRAHIVDFNNYLVRRVNDDDKLEDVIGTGFPGDGDPDQLDKTAKGAPPLTVALNHPSDLVFATTDSQVAATGEAIMTAWHNHRIRVWNPGGNVRAHFGANPGFGGDGAVISPATMLNQPSRLVQDKQGNSYLIDSRNWLIRKVDKAGYISTIAGQGPKVSGEPWQGFDPKSDSEPVPAKGTPFVFFDPIEWSNPPLPGGGLAVSDDGKTLYIADSGNNRIRAMDLAAGTIVTIAGTGPSGCADLAGEATACRQGDTGNFGAPGSFAGDGGDARKARLSKPRDLAWGPDGRLYFADTGNDRVRAIDLKTHIVTTVVGNGKHGKFDDVEIGEGGAPLAATLATPAGIAFGPDGSLYIADTMHNRIRVVPVKDMVQGVHDDKRTFVEPPSCKGKAGCITTVAGTGAQALGKDNVLSWQSDMSMPQDAALAPNGDLYYIDWNNHRVRRHDFATGITTSLVGSGTIGNQGGGEIGTDAALNHPTNIEFDAKGVMWIAAWHNSMIKRFDGQFLEDYAGTGDRTFGGDGGQAKVAKFDLPSSVAFDDQGDLYFSDQSNQRVRKITLATGIVSTVVGSRWVTDTGAKEGKPLKLADGTTYGSFRCANGGIGPGHDAELAPWAVDLPGLATAEVCRFDAGQPDKCARKNGAPVVLKLPAPDVCGGFGGDGGPALNAQLAGPKLQFSYPASRIVIRKGAMYIADTYNHRIRKVDMASGVITTVAGSGQKGYSGDGGDALQAALNGPTDVDLLPDGALVIADKDNQCLRAVKNGKISTYAGQCGKKGYGGDGSDALTALFNEPYGFGVGPDGTVYLADTMNQRIRSISTR